MRFLLIAEPDRVGEALASLLGGSSRPYPLILFAIYALCCMRVVIGRANVFIFMDDNDPFRATLIMILEMFDRKT